MEVVCCNSNDKKYQERLNVLLSDIFLDFKFWYDLDLWDENYESYSISENDVIISNICIYKSKVIFKSKEHLALSLGAVATKKEHRGKGLSKKIMEHIINKYDNVPMYLSANEDVIDFYPKFGFKRVYEKMPTCMVNIDNNILSKKLKFSDDKVRNYIYKRINYSSDFDCINTASINMFHIHLGYLKEDIYELESLKTMIVASQNEEILLIDAMFSLIEISFADLIKALPFNGVKKIEFGFMPNFTDIEINLEDNDTEPWFVRNIKADISNIKFPELSMT